MYKIDSKFERNVHENSNFIFNYIIILLLLLLLCRLVQWVQNKGQCGVCGDAYHLKEPRPHEAGGEYAKGTIVRHYTVGQVISFHHLIVIK